MNFLGDDLKKAMQQHGINIDEVDRDKLIAERDERMKKQAKEYTKKFITESTSAMLSKYSLFSDPDLLDANFNNFKVTNDEQERNKKLARTFAFEYTKPGANFNTLLAGSAGRGKTHLSLGMLKAINEYSIKQGNPVKCLFMDVNKMCRKAKDFEFHGGDSRYSMYNLTKLCVDAKFLVLDDLGTESSLQSESRESANMIQQFLYDILNQRRNTIITTNLSSDQMHEIYNDKVVSRITRHTGNHIIKFTDATKDMRQEGIKW